MSQNQSLQLPCRLVVLVVTVDLSLEVSCFFEVFWFLFRQVMIFQVLVRCFPLNTLFPSFHNINVKASVPITTAMIIISVMTIQVFMLGRRGFRTNKMSAAVEASISGSLTLF